MSELVSVVIVNWRSKAYVLKLWASLQTGGYRPLQVILVNHSPDEDFASVFDSTSGIETMVLTPDSNLGFAGGCNLGIQSARGEYILLLNPDTEVRPQCIESLVSGMERQQADVVCPKLLDARSPETIDRIYDGYSTHGAGVTIGKWEVDRGQYDTSMEVFGPSGAAALYRRSFFDEVGLFDDTLFAYYEDVDLAIRGQLARKKTCYIPESSVYHYGAGSTGKRYNATTVYLSTRNMIRVQFSTLPEELGRRYRRSFYGWLIKWVLYYGLVQRLPVAVARGVWDGFRSAKKSKPPARSLEQVERLASWMERSTEADKRSRANRKVK